MWYYYLWCRLKAAEYSKEIPMSPLQSSDQNEPTGHMKCGSFMSSLRHINSNSNSNSSSFCWFWFMRHSGWNYHHPRHSRWLFQGCSCTSTHHHILPKLMLKDSIALIDYQIKISSPTTKHFSGLINLNGIRRHVKTKHQKVFDFLQQTNQSRVKGCHWLSWHFASTKRIQMDLFFRARLLDVNPSLACLLVFVIYQEGKERASPGSWSLLLLLRDSKYSGPDDAVSQWEPLLFEPIHGTRKAMQQSVEDIYWYREEDCSCGIETVVGLASDIFRKPVEDQCASSPTHPW